MNIKERIEAAKKLSMLKQKPEQLQAKLNEFDQKIEEGLSKIEGGELSGPQLGGLVKSLSIMETKRNKVKQELDNINQILQSLQKVAHPKQTFTKTTSSRNTTEGWISRLPDNKMFTAQEVAEALGVTREAANRILKRGISLGLIRIITNPKRGYGGAGLYAKAKKLPSEVMTDEMIARKEMEDKIRRLQPDPDLESMMADYSYTFDQVKAHIQSKTGINSPIRLGTMVTQKVESGHLKRTVENGKVWFTKN